jgi:hypothetical protein
MAVFTSAAVYGRGHGRAGGPGIRLCLATERKWIRPDSCMRSGAVYPENRLICVAYYHSQRLRRDRGASEYNLEKRFCCRFAAGATTDKCRCNSRLRTRCPLDFDPGFGALSRTALRERATKDAMRRGGVRGTPHRSSCSCRRKSLRLGRRRPDASSATAHGSRGIPRRSTGGA